MSTLRSRELGEELRLLRNTSRLTGEDVLASTGMSLGWLSKLEVGTRGTSALELGNLLGVYKADRTTRVRVAALVAEVDNGAVVRLHHGVPDSVTTLKRHLKLARRVRSYDPTVVPWVLQTEAYAEAVLGLRAAAVTRTEQQDLLFGADAPEVEVFVHEATFRHPVAPPQVMREQFMRLTLMSSWPRVGLRVVPLRSRTYPVLRYPVTLLGLDEPLAPVLYEETETAVVLQDDAGAVAAAKAKLDRVEQLALSAEESKVLFAKWSEEFSADRRES